MPSIMPYRNYKTLAEEGRKDIKFFREDLENLHRMSAVRSFTDTDVTRTLEKCIKQARILLNQCREYQRYLDRMERDEYKSYIHELRKHGGNSEATEERARVANQDATKPKRQITWTT